MISVSRPLAMKLASGANEKGPDGSETAFQGMAPIPVLTFRACVLECGAALFRPGLGEGGCAAFG